MSDRDKQSGLRIPGRNWQMAMRLIWHGVAMYRSTPAGNGIVARRSPVTMPKNARRALYSGLCVVAIASPSFGADTNHGKEIALRWCASCHLVERGQASATDQAPTFAYLGALPEFDANKLAFLLLRPHPNMPNVSLNRADVGDLADYIRTLK